MLIREDLYCTEQHFLSLTAFPTIEDLLSSLESQIDIHQLPYLMKQFMDELQTIATVTSNCDKEAYWSKLSTFLSHHSHLIETIDNIRVLSPISTVQGNQFSLVEHGYPIIDATMANQQIAVIEPYRVPLAECKLSLLSDKISKARAVGNLNLINTQLSLSQHMFMVNNEHRMAALLYKQGDQLSGLFEQLDNQFGQYLMLPSAFAKLFSRRVTISKEDFLKGFHDLLTEAELTGGWGPNQTALIQDIEQARQKAGIIEQSLDATSSFSVQMSGQQFLDTLKQIHPNGWQQELKNIGVDGIAYSDDATSISAQRGRPTVYKYEFFSEQAVAISSPIEPPRYVLEQQQRLSITYNTPGFKAICRRVQHLDHIFDALLMAKFHPNKLDRDDTSKSVAAFIRLYGLKHLTEKGVVHAEE